MTNSASLSTDVIARLISRSTSVIMIGLIMTKHTAAFEGRSKVAAMTETHNYARNSTAAQLSSSMKCDCVVQRHFYLPTVWVISRYTEFASAPRRSSVCSRSAPVSGCLRLGLCVVVRGCIRVQANSDLRVNHLHTRQDVVKPTWQETTLTSSAGNGGLTFSPSSGGQPAASFQNSSDLLLLNES